MALHNGRAAVRVAPIVNVGNLLVISHAHELMPSAASAEEQTVARDDDTKVGSLARNNRSELTLPCPRPAIFTARDYGDSRTDNFRQQVVN